MGLIGEKVPLLKKQLFNYASLEEMSEYKRCGLTTSYQAREDLQQIISTI